MRGVSVHAGTRSVGWRWEGCGSVLRAEWGRWGEAISAASSGPSQAARASWMVLISEHVNNKQHRRPGLQRRLGPLREFQQRGPGGMGFGQPCCRCHEEFGQRGVRSYSIHGTK